MEFLAAHKSIIPTKHSVLENANRVAETMVRRSKHILPHLARICILSTYLEDSIRMFYQWKEQRQYFEHIWKCGVFISALIVMINFFGQLIPCILLLFNRKVYPATYTLLTLVIFQGIVYRVMFHLQYLMRSLSVLGGLIMLLASYSTEENSMLIMLPSMSTGSKTKTRLQLSARLLLAVMFFTLFIVESEWSSIGTWIRLFIGLALILTITFGYHTTLAAIVASIWLMIFNLITNRFWTFPSHSTYHDYYKFDFFQTMSVIGGLLLLISTGPGEVSIDERKKKW